MSSARAGCQREKGSRNKDTRRESERGKKKEKNKQREDPTRHQLVIAKAGVQEAIDNGGGQILLGRVHGGHHAACAGMEWGGSQRKRGEVKGKEGMDKQKEKREGEGERQRKRERVRE